MSLPSVSPQMVGAGTNRFLSRYISSLGISLSEMDYLRGWKDDFFGDQLADQYTSSVNGVGSFIVLLDGVHGGAVSLTSGAGAGRYARLWLGDAADGHDSLNAGFGWVMFACYAISATTNIITRLGISDVALTRYIYAGANTAAGANWYLVCTNAAGTTTVDSGIATDTDYHWHVVEAVDADEVNYYLDGALIATCTTNIIGTVRTPFVVCRSPGANLRAVNLDYLAAIPR